MVLCTIFIAFYMTLSATEGRKTVCLNMIVKDESHVICRCLASVKPLIDYWVIVDTGSTDGTQKIIKDFMKDIPGELRERPWVNFAHNRNEALDYAKGKADYLLFMDADDTLETPQKYSWPILDRDTYTIKIKDAGTIYSRIALVNNKLPWHWYGVLHEFIFSPLSLSSLFLPEISYQYHGNGNRSKDPQKFIKDAQILEEALKKEPNNSRYVFYLAQSYRDAKDYEQALKYYEQRIKMGGYKEEIYWSKVQRGLLQEALKKDRAQIIESYQKAFKYNPSRIEPLYHLSKVYKEDKNYDLAYQTARKGLMITGSVDMLFVEQWIYDWGLLFEFTIDAYLSKHYTEALLASQLLLTKQNLPSDLREAVEKSIPIINSLVFKN